MNLTPSAKKAIEQQKRVFALVHPDAAFTIYTPRNTSIVRLVAEYTIKSVTGNRMAQSQAWTIGKGGKVK